MRFFTLMGVQDIVLYLFPALIFIVIFGMALGYTHFRGKNAEARQREIHGRFPEEITDRNAPFPLALTLIFIGTILWAIGYILAIGLSEVKI